MSAAIVNEGWKRPVRVIKRVQTPPLLTDTAEDRAFARAFQTLSPRRQQILRLLAEGCSSQEVAERLSISHVTVRNTLSVIYAQLGIATVRKSKRACYLLGRYDQRMIGVRFNSDER